MENQRSSQGDKLENPRHKSLGEFKKDRKDARALIFSAIFSQVYSQIADLCSWSRLWQEPTPRTSSDLACFSIQCLHIFNAQKPQFSSAFDAVTR
jgi:hypothetical protein